MKEFWSIGKSFLKYVLGVIVVVAIIGSLRELFKSINITKLGPVIAIIAIAFVLLVIIIWILEVSWRPLMNKILLSKFSREDYFRNKETKEWMNKLITKMESKLFKNTYKEWIKFGEGKNMKEKYEIYTLGIYSNVGYPYFNKTRIEKRIRTNPFFRKIDEICLQNVDFKSYPKQIKDAFKDVEGIYTFSEILNFRNVEFRLADLVEFEKVIDNEEEYNKYKLQTGVNIEISEFESFKDFFVNEVDNRIKNYCRLLNEFNNRYQNSF